MSESPEEYLKRIRAQSSYAALRVVLEVSCVLLMGVGLFLSIWSGAMLLGGSEGMAGPYQQLAGGLALLLLGIAGRQGSLLVVDAVDILIEQGRKKPRTGVE